MNNLSWVVYDYKDHANGGVGLKKPIESKEWVKATSNMWTPDDPEEGRCLILLTYFDKPIQALNKTVIAELKGEGDILEVPIGFWVLGRSESTRWHSLTTHKIKNSFAPYRWELKNGPWIKGWQRRAEQPVRHTLQDAWSVGFSIPHDVKGEFFLKDFRIE